VRDTLNDSVAALRGKEIAVEAASGLTRAAWVVCRKPGLE